MEVRPIDEFVRYCQENVHNRHLPKAAQFAELLQDGVDLVATAYGRRDQIQPDEIEGVYSRLASSKRLEVTDPAFVTSAEILSRFWARSDVFKQWLATKVDVVELMKSNTR